MKETNEYKIVDWNLYNPAESIFGNNKDKAEFRLAYCKNSENCEAYKRGECTLLDFFSEKCPYGKVKKEIGFTPRARKYSKWIQEKKEIVKDITRLSSAKKVTKIGDYYFFPYPHWSLDESVSCQKRAGFVSNQEQYIHQDRFTPEWLVKVLQARPKAIFGGEITSYQQEVVPKIVAHLKEEFPKIHEEVAKLIDLPEVYITYVGRKAVLKTLNPFKYKEKNKWIIWDGKTVTITDAYTIVIALNNYSHIKGEYTFIPDDKVTFIVSSIEQVNKDTKFVE